MTNKTVARGSGKGVRDGEKGPITVEYRNNPLLAIPQPSHPALNLALLYTLSRSPFHLWSS
jgi:hypothetical protein